MRAIKLALTIFVIGLFSWLFYVCVVVPYQANVLKRSVENRFDVLFASTGHNRPNPGVAQQVRSDIAKIERALRYNPTDIDLLMELAAEYRFLGRSDDAERTYQRCLRFARRPEIFQNLSELQYERGHIDDALDSYSHAVAFYPPTIIWVPDQLQREVLRRARLRYGEASGSPAQ